MSPQKMICIEKCSRCSWSNSLILRRKVHLPVQMWLWTSCLDPLTLVLSAIKMLGHQYTKSVRFKHFETNWPHTVDWQNTALNVEISRTINYIVSTIRTCALFFLPSTLDAGLTIEPYAFDIPKKYLNSLNSFNPLEDTSKCWNVSGSGISIVWKYWVDPMWWRDETVRRMFWTYPQMRKIITWFTHVSNGTP